MRPGRTLLAALVALLAPVAATGSPAPGQSAVPQAASPAIAGKGAPAVAIDPWQALAELRLQLAASGALAAGFRQSYIPAGFATGDEESGRIALALPDCLRWDYSEPYPKSYLLCGSRLHTWVPGEPQGERLQVEARDEAGLDLLLLPVELLKTRYSAVARQESGGAIAVDLKPAAPESRIADATLLFDPSTQRPTGLSYRDRDGNVTRFSFAAFELAEDASLFTPPTTIVWQDR